jgi:hypothetical protein
VGSEPFSLSGLRFPQLKHSKSPMFQFKGDFGSFQQGEMRIKRPARYAPARHARRALIGARCP